VVSNDPFAGPEVAVAAETVPGTVSGPWPLPVVRGAGAWLIPWQDAAGVHARLVRDDGGRDDRFVDRGALVGAAATDDGFAVAVAVDGTARVHFVAGDRDDVVTVTLDGNAAPGAASDGQRVLFATTRGGEIAIEDPRPLDASLWLVTRDGGARAVPLGRVAAAPAPWGDARGFIVSGTLLVDGYGAIAAAPGRQVRDARVFRKPIASGTQPTSDTISLDGDGWMTLDGLVGFAAREGAGARLEVVSADAGRALVEVGDDLTPRTRLTLPTTARGDGGQAWVAAASARRVVFAATVDDDPVFVMLDAHDARADSGVIRVHDVRSRSTLVSAGVDTVLLVWVEAQNDGRPEVRYAVEPW
jgi:hypothetical protein